MLRHQEVEDGGVERSPARTQPSASARRPGVPRSPRPSARAGLVMIRRFVALSSTTRTRQPGELARDDRRRGVRQRRRLAGRPRRGGTCCPRRRRRGSRRQRAAHRLGEASADREAEAGPAVAPRDRRVDLAERLEQQVHPLRRDPDAGVADVDGERPTAVGAAAGRRPSTDSTTSPCSVNLIAFDSRFRTIWRSRPGVADDRLGQVVAHRVGELDALPRGDRRDDVEGALDGRRSENGSAARSTLPGLDLREVEDVVDDRQQRVARRPDRLGEVALLGVELRSRRAGRSSR